LIAAAAAATAAQLAQPYVDSPLGLSVLAAAAAASALAWRNRRRGANEVAEHTVARHAAAIAVSVLLAIVCTRTVAEPDAGGHVVGLLDAAATTAGGWSIEARIADVGARGPRGARWLVEAVSVSDPAPRPLRGRIRLSVRTQVPTVAVGERVRFRARLRRISAFGNPGELDWVGWNARRGVFVSAFVWDGRDVEVLSPTPPATLAERWERLRARVTAAAARNGRSGALVAALVTGERRLLDEADARAVRAAGLAHVLAISGLHLGLVGGGVFWLVHRALLETRLARAGIDVARGAALAGVTATLAYTGISGGGVSVARASLMAVAAAAAVWRGRRASGASAMAAAALAISVAMPGVAREAGFQLSFAAVLAIAAYGAALRRRGRRPAAIRGAIELSFLCWAVSSPIVAQHFGRVALYGAAATLVAAPLATAIVAAGLAGAAAIAVGLAALSDPLFLAAAWAADALLLAARGCAEMPAAELRVVAPGPLAAAAAAAAPLSLLCEASARRTLALSALSVLVIAGLAALHDRYRSDRLDVHFLAVGQGDSTVVRLPGGRVAVIDAGAPGRGALVVAPFLRRERIRRVDYLIATHAQDDHAGGIGELLGEVEVAELWTAAGQCGVATFAELRESAQQRGVALVEVGRAGLPVRAGQRWRLSALWPRDAVGECDDNDRSVVVSVEFAGRRVLLGGDIEARAEAALVGAVGREALAADVVSAPHHGSRTSSSPPFVAATSPRVVVASAGQGNRYGFPTAETRERYRRIGARFLTTAVDGAVRVRIDALGGVDVRTRAR
jgi:competence protein ComEC